MTVFGFIPGLRVTSHLVNGAPEAAQSVARVPGCWNSFQRGWQQPGQRPFLVLPTVSPLLLHKELSGGQGPCPTGAATLIIDERHIDVFFF